MAQEHRPVLVVDDQPVMRQLLVDMLREAGYPAESVADGEAAIIRLHDAKATPRLVVLDLLMPKVDGYEVLEFLEGTERLASVPVIVLSALASPPLPDGMRVVRKPVQREAFLETVRAACA